MAEANICTICQNSIYNGRDFLTTGCQHMFHTECIATNANKNDNKCPNCRQPIPSFRNIFTGYENKTIKKKKENLTSIEDDENRWSCPECTYENSTLTNTCEVCEQGIRVQVQKSKPRDEPKMLVQMESNIKFRCNTLFCNTQDPSSRSLCDECISQNCSTTPKTSDILQPKKQEKPSISSRPSAPSSNDSAPKPTEVNRKKLDQTKWRCENCRYEDNLPESVVCVCCEIGHRPAQTKLSSTEHPERSSTFVTINQSKKTDSSQASTRSTPYVSTAKQQQQEELTNRSVNRKLTSISQKTEYDHEDSPSAIVYITDLSTDKSNKDLEQAIQARLQDVNHIQVSRVDAFSNLGVAIVSLNKQKDKDYLVNTVQSFVLSPNDNLKVTCTEQLEVTAYLVFEKGITSPSDTLIARRWKELFSPTRHPKLQTLSIQFPNIMKVTCFSIEELQSVAKHRVFEVEDQIARIHTHVDCSYLEELPRSQPKLDENRLFCFIASQLNMTDPERANKDLCQEQVNILFQQIQSLPQLMKELKSKLYIQYNEQVSNAIILASNSLHKWISMTFLNINSQLIFKTANISTKLIIKSIPLDFPLDLIFDHAIFNKSIKKASAKVNGEHLVVDIGDKQTYDECLRIRAFDVMNNGDRLTMRILPYTILEDPDNCEINVENWYGTQMQKYKPDITQFDPRHPIFRYKWNSKIWLDEFLRNKQELEQITDQDERRQNDFIRRMLRVTVMLNTMGVMRKRKYTFEDSSTKTELLIAHPSPLATTLYNHQSALFPASQTFIPPPFASTNVRVINEDCLIIYSKLASSGMKPLLLNMANALTPGGGYRKGDGAQEENIFRRSNYYMSLDFNMDKEQDQSINSKRNYCTSTGQISPMNANQSLYPMDDYGAIYTSGITVLRDTEDRGYPYLKDPLYDVCAVAIAAYRDPPIQKSKPRLTSKFAIGTRKKIETLFAIAYKNGHDSLVLSALGCGAFKNPPEHIALIFKSVILQYAGFFKVIIFAIIDDHNTGGRLNRDGNFLPFQQALDQFVVRLPTARTVGMSLGPHHLIPAKSNDSITITEFVLGDKTPCEYGSHCNNIADKNHCQLHPHPPLCPFGADCNENIDDVHCEMFIHRRKCPTQGRCLVTDTRHLTDFDHPEFCSEKGHCANIKMDHLNLYRHVPICDKGLECDLILTKNTEHLLRFRHCERPCQFGGNCIRFHDQKHITNEYHPFKQPCPNTPFSCKIFTQFLQSDYAQKKSKNDKELDPTQRHCYRCSHICPWGRLCKDESELHLSITIHILRLMCPNGDTCKQTMEEDHLDSFSHSNIRDIRFLCRHPGAECPDRSKVEHITKYRHNYTLDHLGVAQYFGLNKQINFVLNQSEMTRKIREYVEKTYKKLSKKISVPGDLLEWIAALQPIHRCKAAIFESILVHGHVMSRSYMDKLKDPTFVAHSVEQHRHVRKILANHGPAFQKEAREFIEALISLEFNSTGDDSVQLNQYRIHSKEETLKRTLKPDDIKDIRRCASQIAQASIKLHSNKAGIGHAGDLTFGTNKQVFSILGPHTGSYYGDIVIIFKRDIMLHPDSNFTMQAATMYTDKTYKLRPWLDDPGSTENHVHQFNTTKLHCSVPGYDYVAALELMALTGTQSRTMNVGLKDIICRWRQIDSHQVLEGHLPQLIPLNYIDHIYIPKNVFESLPTETQKKTRDLFSNSLTVTKHVVDLTTDLLAFTKPDESRREYQNYILEQIFNSIKNQQEQNAILSTSQLLTSYGMTVTISATDFKSLTTNSLTISQAIEQYKNQSNKRGKSDDSIYIYWKALRGDFMLILTNEMIEDGKIQPDLVYVTCYIAPFVTNTNEDSNYNEDFTYISDSLPSSHQTIVEQKSFRGSSNIFHKGCDPDDFNLYCLKISRQTGQVSLMNAGVNGIYNHTIVKCTFERKDFDLNSLNFIHVAAGRQSVPIHNLVISYELISEAHPTFSKAQFVNDNIDDHPQNVSSDAKQNPNSMRDRGLSSSINDQSDRSNDESMFSRLSKPIKWMKNKLFPIAVDSSEMNEDDDDGDKLDKQPQFDGLRPCRDSIYCLDQYSREKSIRHNKTYSHPCRFSDLCRNIHRTPHSTEFTHYKHDVPKCRQDHDCKQVTDALHRYSYRHTDLPDLLYPCRDQQRCRDSTLEHRKKYFHGESINLSMAISISKDVSTAKTSSSSQSYQTKVQQEPLTSTSWDALLKQSSSVWSPSDEESDDEDLVKRFYNDDAGKSNITNAGSYDQFGNPTARKYDLGRDGAYIDFSILIGQFYTDFDMQKPIDALKVKGYKVKHVTTENECITELASNCHQIAWIISTNQIQNPSFISTLTTFHSSGGAIFLFADNTPYVCHASEFLGMKFGITVQGDYYGGKTLTYKENGHQETGHYGQHEIFTGIANLFEGITICHPVYSTPASRDVFATIATASDGNSSIGVYDPPSTSTEGRLCLDCGFTKLFYNWDDAGTARYIVNASCWLLGIEKRLKSKKKKNKK